MKVKGARRASVPARAMPAIYRRAMHALDRMGSPGSRPDEDACRAVRRDLIRMARVAAPRLPGPVKQRREARTLLQLIETGIYQGGVAPTPKAVRAFLTA